MKQQKKLINSVITILIYIFFSTQAAHGSQVSSSSLTTSNAQSTASSETKKRAAAKNLVIFGLLEVLLEHSVWEVSKRLGWLTTARYVLQDPNLPNKMRIKRTKVLTAVSTEKPPFPAAGDDQGNLMSRIVFEQQAGIKKSEAAVKEINSTITRLAQDGFFCSVGEETLVTNLINTVDNPEVYIQCMKPVQSAIALIELCLKNQNNELMILSNFGVGMLGQLQKTYPEVFKYFEAKNIIIAGDISEADRKEYFSSPLHVIKPGGPKGEIFRYIEARTGYRGEQITFIDNPKIDVEAAKQICGWQSLQVTDGDFAPIQQALISSGIISSEGSPRSSTQSSIPVPSTQSPVQQPPV